MNHSLVSIIVATKNEEENLRRCLVSCRKQTHKKIEIIVVDNFSQDKTVEIAKKFTKHVFVLGPERSVQKNFGASAAKGDFLLFVDADMELGENLVKNCLSQNSQSVVIPERIPHTNFWSKCRDFEKSLYLFDPLFEAPRFIEKSLFKKAGGYNPKLYAAEDLELSQKLQKMEIFPAHSKYFLIHHEDKINLVKIAQKKFYYGLNLKNYLKNHPKTSLFYVLRPPFLKNYKKIFLHPFLATGMLTLKTLEYISAASGFIWGFVSKSKKFV